jgi:hypothetical protein
MNATQKKEGEKKVAYARYVWLVKNQRVLAGFINPCDIRRYAHTHQEALAHVKNPDKNWNLYKLVKVNKRRMPHA